MSHPLATYTFLPWLRQGLSNSIMQSEATPNPDLRASVDLQLAVRSQGVAGAVPDAPLATNKIQLYGPGEILGIDSKLVFKTEPRHWITNFEPNNLAHIEFYDEDLPWRYTPAHANTATHRHLPWIMLIVLEEGEFKEGQGQGPAPFIEIPDLTKLPVKEELWAWAHVHANVNLGGGDSVIVSDAGAAVADSLRAAVESNPDLAYSRIVCPRELEPDKPYHAFLIPSFETGRVAGLGLDVTKVDDALRGAWEAHPQRGNLAGGSFPYYYRWFFRTGAEGDFESLVRLLKPRPMDARVGHRDIDVQRPGSSLRGIPGPDANGVLRLGGALRIPEETLPDDEKQDAKRFDDWAIPGPHPFQKDLAAFINLADDYSELTATAAHERPVVPPEIGALPNGDTDPDPLITPPLYGTWHAMTKRLLLERDGTSVPNTGNWVHELNLDPRHRTSAGFGTNVVRDRQEEFMNAAWEQVGEVLEANRKVRWAQFAKSTSLAWYARNFIPLQATQPERVLMLSAPVSKRVLIEGFTLRKCISDSALPAAAAGTAMRRVLRPNGRLVRSVAGVGVAASSVGSAIVRGLNEKTLTTAQPPALPKGAPTEAGLADELKSGVPGWVADLLAKYPAAPLWILIGGLVLAFILFLLGLGPLALLAAAAAVGAYLFLRNKGGTLQAAESLRPENKTPESVAALPPDPTFTIETFGAVATMPAAGSGDSPVAVRFKQALTSTILLDREALVANAPVVRAPLDLSVVARQTLTTLDPARSIPAWLYKAILLPIRITDGMTETFVEAMAYPRIDQPMYRPLADISGDLLLPNVGLIPHNSLSLLETNQRFIESYMVGLNHEFARELLWREYPTDQRGSYFRQFWDVSSYQNLEGLSPDALREKLYDIPKLHLWPKASTLGAHDNRQPPGSPPKEEVVLSIRGELLKRYPTAVIYAHKAAWQLKPDGSIDQGKIRFPEPLTPDEEANPPRDKVKDPLYGAKVDPDITFLGFDLDIKEAKGDPATNDPGWFFVIKERPGEPRFGLDIDRGGAPINSWSDLAWPDVTTTKSILRINAGMNEYTLTTPPPASEGPEEMAQHLEDKQVRWVRATNAADVAYVLYQLPVLVAVHAAEMLPKTQGS
jgi:hypothetical protein